MDRIILLSTLLEVFWHCLLAWSNSLDVSSKKYSLGEREESQVVLEKETLCIARPSGFLTDDGVKLIPRVRTFIWKS